MPFKKGDPNINRAGRPPKEREQAYVRVVTEIITLDRFRELLTLAYLEAKGFRPIYDAENKFTGVEKDPASTPQGRHANRRLIMEYVIGKPVLPIDLSPDFGDLIKQFAKTDDQTLDNIIAQAEKFIQPKT